MTGPQHFRKPPVRKDLSEWSDADMLEALDMAERQWLPVKDIAEKLNRSKSAICGTLKRIRDGMDHESEATKPENMDGGMPARWWETGLYARVKYK